MQLILAVTPEHLRNALRYTEQLAHVAYRMGEDGHLHRQNLLMQTRGGLMLLTDKGCGEIPDAALLVRETWQECMNRSYTGVVADFDGEPDKSRITYLNNLCRSMRRSGKRLYVPSPYAKMLPQTVALICTAISGGSLRQYLDDNLLQFGSARIALDLQRLRMDFPLPCPGGVGTPLSGEELRQLLAQHPSVFYSRDLCAKYFTYNRDGKNHFVLFDDGDTLQKKLQIGEQLGISTAFALYPEVEELLPRLFSKEGSSHNGRGGRCGR